MSPESRERVNEISDETPGDTSVSDSVAASRAHSNESGSGTSDRAALKNHTEQSDETTEACRFLISIHHPAQVHFYRYIIEGLRNNGHLVRVCVRDKEMTAELLTAFRIEHDVLARSQSSLTGTALSQAKYESKLLREAWLFQPDVLSSIGGIEISHIAPIVGARSLAFMDTPSQLAYRLTAPGLDKTCVPAAYEGQARGEVQRYNGYHELAYLHPEQFTYQPDRLRNHGINPEDRLFVVRLVEWGAYHDVGQKGFDQETRDTIISELDKHGTVYITSEKPLPPALAEYGLDIPPHLVHDLLAAAELYVGDSGTMATEAAVLGTPAIRVSSVVENGDMSNFVELDETYGLIDIYANGKEALSRVRELLDTPETAEIWDRKRERLLSDKINVTAFAIEQLEELGVRSRHEEVSIYA